MRLPRGLYIATALAFTVTACQPNAPFRENTTACIVGTGGDGAECASHSLEEHPIADFPGRFSLLGFIEIDDQGKPYTRDQIDTLFNRVEEEARYKDLSIIVYIHGWKHNDTAADTNVRAFRGLLSQMAEMELRRAQSYWPAREVVGIYVGWRGLSFDAGRLGRI